MELREMLQNEIEDELDNLQSMQLGSPEYEKTLKGISVLLEKLNAIDAQEVEKAKLKQSKKFEKKKLKQNKKSEKAKLKQAKDSDKRSWITNLALGAAGIVIPSGITIWGAKHSWGFEKDGYYSSFTSKIFANKLFKK